MGQAGSQVAQKQAEQCSFELDSVGVLWNSVPINQDLQLGLICVCPWDVYSGRSVNPWKNSVEFSWFGENSVGLKALNS